MRRIILRNFISSIVCLTIIVNLFSGSLLCLLALDDGDHDIENLELIKIPLGVVTKNFQRLNDHEIIYCGKLYDVEEQFTKGDFIYYYCENDTKEEKVLEQVKQCIESNLDYFNSRTQTVPVTNKFFTQQNFSMNVEERNLPVSDFLFCNVNNKTDQEIFLSEINPPPEIFFS